MMNISHWNCDRRRPLEIGLRQFCETAQEEEEETKLIVNGKNNNDTEFRRRDLIQGIMILIQKRVRINIRDDFVEEKIRVYKITPGIHKAL